MAAQPVKRQKHIPMRTCVICRKKADKRSLSRVVLTEAGLQVDRTGKLTGRGAYLCADPSCWDKAMRTTVLDKALRTTLTDNDRKRLHEVYNRNGQP